MSEGLKKKNKTRKKDFVEQPLSELVVKLYDKKKNRREKKKGWHRAPAAAEQWTRGPEYKQADCAKKLDSGSGRKDGRS